MKATITIDKSFDESREFSKVWERGDFEEFMKEEGEYLDRLAKVADDNGAKGKIFTVTYTVSLKN